MKTQVALLTLLAVTSIALYALGNTQNAHNESFEVWKTQYGKSYSTHEETYRLGIWLKNLKFVESHNKKHQLGQESYEVEMNAFADMTEDEFSAKYLIRYPSQVTSKCTGSQAPVLNLPDEVDWSQKGAVTPIKNQGQCGSCWAFSATGSMEGVHFIKQGKLLSFSEQQLVDCSRSYKNQGCDGGLMNQTFFYVKDHGIATEDRFPYKGIGMTCKYDESKDKAWQISDCTEVKVNSEEALMAAIAQNPVSVAVQAGELGFQLYKKGVFSGPCSTKLDHGVLAVGYGTQSSKPYYKVKNSWGAKWGRSGYIYILRNGDGVGKCGIQMAASYPIA